MSSTVTKWCGYALAFLEPIWNTFVAVVAVLLTVLAYGLIFLALAGLVYGACCVASMIFTKVKERWTKGDETEESNAEVMMEESRTSESSVMSERSLRSE